MNSQIYNQASNYMMSQSVPANLELTQQLMTQFLPTYALNGESYYKNKPFAYNPVLSMPDECRYNR